MAAIGGFGLFRLRRGRDLHLDLHDLGLDDRLAFFFHHFSDHHGLNDGLRFWLWLRTGRQHHAGDHQHRKYDKHIFLAKHYFLLRINVYDPYKTRLHLARLLFSLFDNISLLCTSFQSKFILCVQRCSVFMSNLPLEDSGLTRWQAQ